MLIVYMQLYSTLSVYLRDVHGIPAQGYGLLLSLNACVVVVAQLWLSHRIKAYAPLLMMAVGTWLYLVGFTMYGLFSTYPAFVIAMLVITFGEMIVVPVEQTIAARFAPADMRGRYMAVYGLAHAVASAVGPGAAGLIMDHFDPRWVWYGGGLLCALAIAAFCVLHLKTQARFETASAEGQSAVAAS
jgi:MFS family permease